MLSQHDRDVERLLARRLIELGVLYAQEQVRLSEEARRLYFGKPRLV